MSSWHLTMATDGRDPLFRGEMERRSALRAVARLTGLVCALFSLVDDHLHLVLLCDRQQAGRLARALLIALRPLAAVALQPARLRPVEGRGHAQWLLRYLLEQPAHHGLPVHPALWTGSCFADLVGARRLAGLRLQVPSLLPRFRLREAYELVKLPVVELVPVSDADLRELGVRRIASAAGAALAVGPDLTGRAARVVEARVAICQLTRAAGLRHEEAASALGLSRQGFAYLAAQPVEAASLASVRLRLALERAVLASSTEEP